MRSANRLTETLVLVLAVSMGLTLWTCGPTRRAAHDNSAATGPQGTMATDTDKRVHVDKVGVVAMALPPAEAFPLFSAEGEREWVAGWNPRYLHRTESGAGEGVVCQTTHKNGRTATWIQTRHDPPAGAASFLYVIPEHHTAMVDVVVSSDGEGRSQATVRYRMTSLSPDADDFVRAFGADFERTMAHWAEAIQRHVVERVPLAHS